MKTIYLGPWKEIWYTGASRPSFERPVIGKPTVSGGDGSIYMFGGVVVYWYETKQLYSDSGFDTLCRRFTAGAIVGKSAKSVMRKVDAKFMGIEQSFDGGETYMLVPLDKKKYQSLMVLA